MRIQSISSVITLGNATELATGIIRGMLGQEVADTIMGSDLTNEVLHDMIQVEFQKSMTNTLGVKQC